MRRGYLRIRGTIWTGATGLALRGLPRGERTSVRLLMLYFATSPHAEATGLYRVEPEIIQLETGLSPTEVVSGVAQLRTLEFLAYDAPSGWVWVREMAAHQFGGALSPKDYNCLNVRRWYRDCPKNPHLGAWWDRYRVDFHLEAEPEPAVRRDGTGPLAPVVVEAPSQAPPQGAPKPRSGSRSDHDQDQIPEGFVAFWTAYPRKEKKQQALVTWRKLKPTPDDLAAMLVKLQHANWPTYWLKEFPDHVPHPSTWLNDRRWEDEQTHTSLTSRTLRTARVLSDFIEGTADGSEQPSGPEGPGSGVRGTVPRLGP